MTDIDSKTSSLVSGLKAAARVLSMGWLEYPPEPTERFRYDTGGYVISQVSGLDAERRRQWYRRDNSEHLIGLRNDWRKVRDRFDADLASRMDGVLEQAIGLQGRESLDNLATAESLAEELRELASLVSSELIPTGRSIDQGNGVQLAEKKRGAKVRHDRKKDLKLRKDWDAAKANGAEKLTFCVNRGTTVADLDAALNRTTASKIADRNQDEGRDAE